MGKYVRLGSCNSKDWGNVQCLFLNDHLKVDYIQFNKNDFCSVHIHENSYNKFFVIEGQLRVKIFRDYTVDITDLYAGMATDVPPNVFHKFEVIENGKGIEIYYLDDLNPDDIVRIIPGGKDISQTYSDQEILDYIQQWKSQKRKLFLPPKQFNESNNNYSS